MLLWRFLTYSPALSCWTYQTICPSPMSPPPPPPPSNYCLDSTAGVVGQSPAVYSHFSGAVPGGTQRHMSFASTYSVVTPSTSSSCGSPSTPSSQPMAATTPPRRTRSLQQQQQQPSPPFRVRRGEQQQPQQQQQQIKDLLPPLSALSPKTAAAALGMETSKGSTVGAAGGELSSHCLWVLPGYQVCSSSPATDVSRWTLCTLNTISRIFPGGRYGTNQSWFTRQDFTFTFPKAHKTCLMSSILSCYFSLIAAASPPKGAIDVKRE